MFNWSILLALHKQFYVTSQSFNEGFSFLNDLQKDLGDFPTTHCHLRGNDPLSSNEKVAKRSDGTFYWLLQMANQERARRDNRLGCQEEVRVDLRSASCQQNRATTTNHLVVDY